VGLYAAGLGAQHADLLRPARLPEEYDPGEQRQPAPAGDQQRLQRRRPRRRALVVEADEQVRAETRQLPEDEQQEQVVGKHEPQHRGHKQQGEGLEATAVRTSRQVAIGVHEHERPDARDEQGEQQAQAVQGERQIEAQAGHPGNRRLQCLAAGDPRRLTEEVARQPEQRHGQQPARSSCAVPLQPGGE
jgi:hypothetical protein